MKNIILFLIFTNTSNAKLIAITGTHGVGKTTIMQKVKSRKDIITIDEQFRILQKQIGFTKQTNEITNLVMLCQLHLENLFANKNTLADRTIFDTWIYHDYFNKTKTKLDKSLIKRYDKIYLIMPSNRPIFNDGFRLTNKKEQNEIHKRFEAFFEGFDNVVIINQEEQEEIVKMILKDFDN